MPSYQKVDRHQQWSRIHPRRDVGQQIRIQTPIRDTNISGGGPGTIIRQADCAEPLVSIVNSISRLLLTEVRIQAGNELETGLFNYLVYKV
jgi:hypothetical protein